MNLQKDNIVAIGLMVAGIGPIIDFDWKNV